MTRVSPLAAAIIGGLFPIAAAVWIVGLERAPWFLIGLVAFTLLAIVQSWRTAGNTH